MKKTDTSKSDKDMRFALKQHEMSMSVI